MTKSEAIAELVRIWHSPHLDLSLKAGLAEAIETLKENNRSDSLVRDEVDVCKESESKLDLIRRSDAIEAIFKVGHEHVEEKVIPLGAVTDYSDAIKALPSAEAVDMAIEALSAEPKIYGNEHNCVLTMFGECSYDRNGCGSCEVVDKIRKAINAEPKTDEENELKFYYVESIDDYWIGQRLDNFYYADWHDGLGFVWSKSRYLPWGEHIVNENTLWKEHTYPSEPIEIPFTEWIVGFVKKYFAEPKTGEWDICKYADDVYGVCSICGCYADFSIYGRPYKVCPNCGAKMTKGGEDE